MKFEAQRVVDMIDFLETEVKENHFNMKTWITTSITTPSKVKKALKSKSNSTHCKTSACSWGHAPLIWPLDWHYVNRYPATSGYIAVRPLRSESKPWDERYIMNWFGISLDEVDRLFVGSYAMRRTLKQQIKRLKKFLDEKDYEMVEE